MRVCYFGTYRANYSRNRIMIEGLRRSGVDVMECHETLWHGVDERVAAASGQWLRPAFLLRAARVYLVLIWRYLRCPQHDVVVVGYPGQFDVFLARVLASLRRRPLVWDIFMSIYLIALERGLDARSPFTVNLLRRIEQLACRLPDRLILDTEDYANWFGRVHGVGRERFRLVPTGADDTYQRAPAHESPNRRATALYFGSFIRNHGVEWIIEAARLLQGEPHVCFELIGDGPERARMVALAESYRLTNVSFVPWLPKEQLQEHIARADICLGAFGDTPQSLMTVQNKIYEGMAAGRAVLTGDSSAVRRVFRHCEHLYLVPRGDAAALADGIRVLAADPALREQMAEAGHQEFMQKYTVAATGARFAAHLAEMVH